MIESLEDAVAPATPGRDQQGVTPASAGGLAARAAIPIPVVDTADPLVGHEEIWLQIRAEAAADVEREPALAGFLHNAVLRHDCMADALAYVLATKLDSPSMDAHVLRDFISEAIHDEPEILEAVFADVRAIVTRDPATRGFSQPLLYLKGFHAVQAYRVAHHFWMQERHALALYLQNRISEVFAVDIHPGARIGKGVMFDHATSVVIGETAVVGDDFSMLHEVTLGGTGKEGGDRHPKIGRGVMIGAGAKVLGNITVGECAKVGAGSVVLRDVAPHTTVAGIPARPVSLPATSFPALDMDQSFDIDGDAATSGGPGAAPAPSTAAASDAGALR